jgi:hypothetical protein
MTSTYADKETRYFATLTAGMPIAVERTFGEAKGRGVRVLRAVGRSDVVFSENPLLSLQHHDNSADVKACGRCGRFVGSVQMQLELMATAPGHSPMLTAGVSADAC